MIILSSMQLNDTKIEEFGRNDGIKSISHCQEKFFISYNVLAISHFENYKNTKNRVNISKWTELKYLCYMNPECEGFTLSSEFKCILHRTAKTVHFTPRRNSQIGIRNRTSTFPKYCEEEQRLERCKNEPTCDRIMNCFRKGSFIQAHI